MRSIRADFDEMVRNLPEENMEVFAPEKMRKVTTVFREWDRKMSEEALHNASLFFDIKNKLNSCANAEKEGLVLLNLAQVLKDHDKEFYDRFIKNNLVDDTTYASFEKTGLLKHISPEKQRSRDQDLQRQNNLMAALTEIKSRHAQKENEIKELSTKVDTLVEVFQNKIRKYKMEIIELRSSMKNSKKSGRARSDLSTESEPLIFYHLAGKKYMVRDTFKRTNKREISLKKGDVIKIIMPPDYRGLALVEKKGWFGQRKRGLFPAVCLGTEQ